LKIISLSIFVQVLHSVTWTIFNYAGTSYTLLNCRQTEIPALPPRE